MHAQTIGARLRHAREARRGSHSADVEARTGLSKGFLSKVERDASSPSVANLVAICDAIGLPMADLFAVPRTTLIRHADRPSLEGPAEGERRPRHADHARAASAT